MDLTLAELQEMASRQQQQIEAQQQMLATKVRARPGRPRRPPLSARSPSRSALLVSQLPRGWERMLSAQTSPAVWCGRAVCSPL